jgi:hypothetical protein
MGFSFFRIPEIYTFFNPRKGLVGFILHPGNYDKCHQYEHQNTALSHQRSIFQRSELGVADTPKGFT